MFQTNAQKLLDLKQRHIFQITDYSPRKITSKKDPEFVQNSDNCWLFGCLNNLLFDTGIKGDSKRIKKFIQGYGINPEGGNNAQTGGSLICEFFEEKNIGFFKLFPLQNPELFAKLLAAGYAFVYSRESGKMFLNDVAGDDEVDDPFTRSTPDQHTTNICLENGKLVEKGSYGNNNIFNQFTYKNINVFIESIKRGGIRPAFYFFDFKKDA